MHARLLVVLHFVIHNTFVSVFAPMADDTGVLVPKTALAGVTTVSLQLLEETVQYGYVCMSVYLLRFLQ